jgi:hypothetical protein
MSCESRCRLTKLWPAYETVHLFYAGRRADGNWGAPLLSKWFLGLFNR